MKKFMMLLMTMSLAVALAACGGDDSSSDDKEDGADKGESEQASKQQDKPEPNLEGVPDVVAKVNGEEINKKEFKATYKSQFQQLAMRYQMQGKKLDQDKMKKQTANNMVGTELLLQEVNNRDLKASDKAVDKTLEELAKQKQVESKDKLLSTLKEQGMKEKEIMSQVKQRVKMDKLIANESGDLEPTEEEMKKAYDQFKSQREKMKKDDSGDIPSYEDMKSDLKSQVKRQNKGKATQKIIDGLRDDADVTIKL